MQILRGVIAVIRNIRQCYKDKHTAELKQQEEANKSYRDVISGFSKHELDIYFAYKAVIVYNSL